METVLTRFLCQTDMSIHVYITNFNYVSSPNWLELQDQHVELVVQDYLIISPVRKLIWEKTKYDLKLTKSEKTKYIYIYIYMYVYIYLLQLYVLYFILNKTQLQFFRLDILGFLIEFKYIITLNLNILEKYNIICILLVNATMCLNSIREPNVPNLRNYT